MLLTKNVDAEDDDSIAHLITMALGDAGFLCLRARDGSEALNLVRVHAPDLLVLDVMMPRLDGREVAKRVKADVILSKTPILMLTARGSLSDRVRGLDSGADDYLVKPFALRELTARIRALLRREMSASSVELRWGDLTLDTARQLAHRGDRELTLTLKEFAVLRYLMTRPEHVVSSEELLEHVWDYHFDPQTNVIDVHVSRLRSKVDKGFARPLIHTIRGAGYMVRVGAEGTQADDE